MADPGQNPANGSSRYVKSQVREMLIFHVIDPISLWNSTCNSVLGNVWSVKKASIFSVDPITSLHFRYFLAGLAVVLALLTAVSDLNPSSSSAGMAKAESISKEIPTPKYASMMAGPSIKFLYW